jgi:SAM-dependent methyltransferase
MPLPSSLSVRSIRIVDAERVRQNGHRILRSINPEADSIVSIHIVSRMRSFVVLRLRAIEDGWFDRSRRVQTAGDAVPHRATDTIGPARDGYLYLPGRPRNVRAALRALPLPNPSEYTFIDLGSGKGRSVFIAAELPFQRVVGVEYSAALHRQAEANAQTLRRGNLRCKQIDFIHGDAAEYDFPAGRIVLFLFNPFGPEVMGCVLANLQRSLRSHPRHVIILLLWPELAHMVAAVDGMRLREKTRRFEIYENNS